MLIINGAVYRYTLFRKNHYTNKDLCQHTLHSRAAILHESCHLLRVVTQKTGPVALGHIEVKHIKVAIVEELMK